MVTYSFRNGSIIRMIVFIVMIRIVVTLWTIKRTITVNMVKFTA